MRQRGRNFAYAVWFLFSVSTKAEIPNIRIGSRGELLKHAAPLVNWTFIDTFLAEAQSNYTSSGLGLERALPFSGGLTEERLRSVFDKCSTPGGAVIRVAAVGGSITAHWTTIYDSNFVSRFAINLQKACPNAKVVVANAARGATGSLTTSLCLEALVGGAPDILFTEFALNDESMYRLTTDPFELLYRSALSDAAFAGASPPAAIGVIFWGSGFSYETAQKPQLAVLRHYNCTAFSVRDLIWPFVMARRAPYASKQDVCIDAHHPTPGVHLLTGNLLAQYVFQLFKSWQKEPREVRTQLRSEFASWDRAHKQQEEIRQLTLPEPINPPLGAFGGASGGAQCAICGDPKAAGARDPELFEAHGWGLVSSGKADENRMDRQRCMELQAVTAEGFFNATLEKGFVFLSNCMGHQGLNANFKFRPFALEVVLTDGTHTKLADCKRERLNLVPLVAGVSELFHNDPPLPPGSYVFALVASDTAKSYWTTIAPRLGSDLSPIGFFAIVTM